jgi:hypothetical protein
MSGIRGLSAQRASPALVAPDAAAWLRVRAAPALRGAARRAPGRAARRRAGSRRRAARRRGAPDALRSRVLATVPKTTPARRRARGAIGRAAARAPSARRHSATHAALACPVAPAARR